MREYIAALETHLAEAHRQAVRLVKRQATLGSSLAEFGTAMIALGKCDILKTWLTENMPAP